MAMCPYCGESVDGRAVLCRSCGRFLSSPSTEADAALPEAPGRLVGEGAVRFTHSGHRYVLGYGSDFFGVWARDVPGGPVQRFPRTDDGWARAWVAYEDLEPGNVPVAEAVGPSWMRPRASVRVGSGAVRDVSRPAPVSPLWWALPVLIGIMGGLIAWAFTRERDPRMARLLLWGGVAINVASYVLARVLHLHVLGL